MVEWPQGTVEPARVLSLYPSLLAPIGALQALGNLAGRSGSLLWRYDSRAGTLLLRCWPGGLARRVELSQIHDWLSVLSDLSILPIPFRSCSGATLVESQESLWELTPWLEGEPASSTSVSEGQVATVFRFLARVHRCLERQSRRGPSPALQSRLADLVSLSPRECDDLKSRARVAHRGAFAVGVEEWSNWVGLVAPPVISQLERLVDATCSIQPILRDARPSHFLFLDSRLSGLVDFGAMGVDSVAVDLARMLSEWFPRDDQRRAKALEAYVRERPLDLPESALIPALEDALAVLVGAGWIRTILASATMPAASAEAGLEHGLSLIRGLAAQRGFTAHSDVWASG